MKKVLVMGGNQFLGKRVCEILLEKKYEVFAINRGNRKNLKNINFLKCDRNNEEELRKITENLKVDYIIDISAYTGEQADILQKIMSGKFKQYILISSASVYNNIESYPVQEESSKGKNEIWGQYAEDKYLAEKVTVENSDRYNFKYTIFRPFYIYGEENNLDREKYIFSFIMTACGWCIGVICAGITVLIKPEEVFDPEMLAMELLRSSCSILLSMTVPGVTTRMTSRFTSPFAALGSSICSQMATL